jgi:serine/threonine-protein kinase
MFLDAGRGLAAAHAAGIVHRDFKPTNVVVGDDGRVRVLDFGLAHFVEDVPKEEDVSNAAPTIADASLTLPNVAMGTPAYMAPEQHAAGPSDVRTDVYNFCASLFEGVYRRRPFDGPVDEIFERKQAGRIEVPTSPRVPTFLWRAIRRGLSPDPARRHRSMDELLQELSVNRRRRRSVALVLGGASVVLATVATWRAMATPPSPCEGGETRMAEVWNESIAADAEQRFAATGLPYAAHAWQTARTALDGYAEQWIGAYGEACEATHVYGVQSEALLDRRMYCLEQRRAHVLAIAEQFQQADAAVVEHAVDLAESPLRLATCLGDPEALAAALSPEARVVAEALERELARVEVILETAKSDELDQRTATLIARARDAGRPEIEMRALLLRTNIEEGRGQFDAAERTALTAMAVAASCEPPCSTASIWIVLARATERQNRYAAAEHYASIAAAWLDAGPDDPGGRWELERVVGQLAFAQRRYDEARAAFERALAAFDNDDPSDAALLHHDLGNVATLLGDYQHAGELYEKARDISIHTFGADHPRAAASLGALGTLARKRGDPETAVRHLGEAVAVLEAAGAGAEGNLGVGLANLGRALNELRRFEAARRAYQRSLEIFERHHTPDHLNVASALAGLGYTQLALGDRAGALVSLERALAIRDRPGTDRNELMHSLFTLARALEPDDPARALELAKRAQAVRDAERLDAVDIRTLDAWIDARD